MFNPETPLIIYMLYKSNISMDNHFARLDKAKKSINVPVIYPYQTWDLIHGITVNEQVMYFSIWHLRCSHIVSSLGNLPHLCNIRGCIWSIDRFNLGYRGIYSYSLLTSSNQRYQPFPMLSYFSKVVCPTCLCYQTMLIARSRKWEIRGLFPLPLNMWCRKIFGYIMD